MGHCEYARKGTFKCLIKVRYSVSVRDNVNVEHIAAGKESMVNFFLGLHLIE